MRARLELLKQKVPDISTWIRRTLTDYAEPARTVNSICFPRLAKYYPADLLTATKVVPVDHVPTPPLRSMGLPEFEDFETMKAAGITYLDTYFVRKDAVYNESLHFHELVHVVQWRHLGAERFLLAYALGHLLCGGYRSNPLEVIAYDLQARFEQSGEPFDAPTETRRFLDATISPLLAQVDLA